MPYTGRKSYPTQVLPGALDFSYERPYLPGTYRTYRISVACPDTPQVTSAPIVIFCHGGARGANYNAVKQTDWGEVLASQGYIVVMVTHIKPGDPTIPQATVQAEVNAIITHLQIANPPQPFKMMNYLRLLDLDHLLTQRATVDAAISQATGGSLSIDVSPGYAIAGHSAGSSAALAAAGATRFFGGCVPGSVTRSGPLAPAPVCALAFSQQGSADVDHLCGPSPFSGGSWASISTDMPVLGVTGYGDTTAGVPLARSRLEAYAEMSGNGHSKFQFWLRANTAGADPGHSFYNHASPAFVAENEWMEDTSFAFLDYFMLGDLTARSYMNNGDVVTDSSGRVRWAMK